MNKKWLTALMAILLAGMFLLWPRKPSRIVPAPMPAGTPASVSSMNSDLPAPPISASKGSPGSKAELRAPEYHEIKVTPELPPEQTVEWQMTRQLAMLKAIEHHLEVLEAKLGETRDPAEKKSVEEQIQILRLEMAHQQAALQKLRE